MKEYIEITEDPINLGLGLYPSEHLLVYVNNKAESQAILDDWKTKTKVKKWRANHIISKHEEGLPCEAELLEEVTE